MRLFLVWTINIFSKLSSLGSGSEAWEAAWQSVSPRASRIDLQFSREELVAARGLGWQHYVENSEDYERYWAALSVVEDNEAMGLIQKEVSLRPYGSIARDIIASGNPKLFIAIVPLLLKDEPWRNSGRALADGVFPSSYEAASIILMTLAESKFCSRETSNWASDFGASPVIYLQPEADEIRNIVRRWWRVNGRAVNEGKWDQIKPGDKPELAYVPPPVRYPDGPPMAFTHKAVTLDPSGEATPGAAAGESKVSTLPKTTVRNLNARTPYKLAAILGVAIAIALMSLFVYRKKH